MQREGPEGWNGREEDRFWAHVGRGVREGVTWEGLFWKIFNTSILKLIN